MTAAQKRTVGIRLTDGERDAIAKVLEWAMFWNLEGEQTCQVYGECLHKINSAQK